MKRLAVIITLGLLIACAVAIKPTPVPGTVLYAQTIPATVTARWSANAASENVTAYILTTDAGAPLVVAPSVCVAGTCSQVVSISSFGPHTIMVAARNLKLSTDPASIQTGPGAAVSFTLNQQASLVSGVTVGP